MKKKYLKIKNPCSEKWMDMQANESGRFCNSCSKTVYDLSSLSPLEIAIKFNNKENICARFTNNQLSTPIPSLDIPTEYSFPFSNIAASLMLAGTLTIGQTVQAKNPTVKTEFVQTSEDLQPKPISKETDKEVEQTSSLNYLPFRGQVNCAENNLPIENVKITLFTKDGSLSTRTTKDGTFTLNIPSQLINNENLIRVSFKDGTINDVNESFLETDYKDVDYVLSIDRLHRYCQILTNEIPAIVDTFTLGEPVFFVSQKRILPNLSLRNNNPNADSLSPLVLFDGSEMKLKDYIYGLIKHPSKYGLEYKELHYFESTSARVIYGEKAKGGLYIIQDIDYVESD
jgi:hypothetical protein